MAGLKMNDKAHILEPVKMPLENFTQSLMAAAENINPELTQGSGTIEDPFRLATIFRNDKNQVFTLAMEGGSSSSGSGGSVEIPEDVARTGVENTFTVAQTFNKSLKITDKAGIIKDTQFDADSDVNERRNVLIRLRDKNASSTAGVDLFIGDAKKRSSSLMVFNKGLPLGELGIKSDDGVKGYAVAPIPDISSAKNEEIAAVKNLRDINTRIDNLELGGGASYVVTPKITAPVNDSTNQSTLINIVGSAYKNVFPDDARRVRKFQVATDDKFNTVVKDKEVDADSWTVDSQLNANTPYWVRIKDYSAGGLESNFSPAVKFTTGKAVQVVSPTITLKGYNDSTEDFGRNLKIELTPFQVSDGQQDDHESTSYYIDAVDTFAARSHIWEKLKDTDNKTGLTVTIEALQPSTKYRLSVIYHGKKYGDSAVATKEFTTSSDFGKVNTPTLTVQGEPNNVQQKPRLTGGAFSNTREEDTHDKSDWEIVPAAGGAVVWSSKDDAEHKTTITVDKGKLQVSTAYKARLRYHGAKFGWSEWVEKQFSTVEEFDTKETQGIHLITSKAISGEDFFINHSWVEPSNFKVIINSSETGQNMFAITANEGDDILIKAVNEEAKFPVFKVFHDPSSYVSHDCVKSLVEPFPLMWENSTTVVKKMQYTFYNCKSLESIPEYIFANNPELTHLHYGFWGCHLMSEIPENIFAYNSKLVEIYDFFGETNIEYIPENLFTNNTELKMFGGCFNGCINLKEIPEQLFANNRKLTNLSYSFCRCEKLTSIPENLFSNNTELTNIVHVFRGCKGLTSIPVGLFKNNRNLEKLSACFWDCQKLQNIPEGLLDNNLKLEDLYSFLEDCYELQSIPENLLEKLTNLTNVEDFISSCKALNNASLKITAGNITEADNFAQAAGSTVTVKLPRGSTSVNTFRSARFANVNIIEE